MHWPDEPSASAVLEDAALVTTLRYDPRLDGCNANPTVAGQPTRFYMITYHHQRLLEAAEHLGFDKAIKVLGNIRDFHCELEQGLDKAPDGLGKHGDRPLRVRVALSREGNIEISFQLTPEVTLATLYPERFTGYDINQINGDGEGLQSKEATDNNPEVLHKTLDIEKSKSIVRPKSVAPAPWAVIISPTHTIASPITTFKHDQRDVYNKARENMQGEYDNSAFSNFEVLLVDRQTRILDGSISTPYFRRNSCWVTPPTGVGDGRWGGLKSVTRRWALDRGMAIELHVDANAVIEGEKVWLSNGARGFFPGVVVRNLLRNAHSDDVSVPAERALPEKRDQVLSAGH